MRSLRGGGRPGRCFPAVFRAAQVGPRPRLAWLICRADSLFTAANSNYHRNEDVDAILVLGGGLHPDGSLPLWVERRLDVSIQCRKSQGRDCPIVCLGGGTPHKLPVLTPQGFVLHEATACSRYLRAKGVPPSSILKEVSSYDTVGNGYFALTIHAIPAGWRRLALVTSAFHMARSAAIVHKWAHVAGRSLFGDAGHFIIETAAASDTDVFAPDVLAARAAREAASLAAWHRDTDCFTAFAEMRQWLYSTHLCYAVSREDEFGITNLGVSDKAIATY